LPSIKDLVGKQYGRLTVLHRIGSNKYGQSVWLCHCICGKDVEIVGGSLQSGRTKSCGCITKERLRKRNKLLRLPFGELSFHQLVGAMKHNAKRRNYVWDLTDQEVRKLTSLPCFYCNTEPSQKKINPQNQDDIYMYNGLDRIDNSKGYTIDNVVSCCGTCNKAKLAMTIKEFKSWICRIYEHFGSRP